MVVEINYLAVVGAAVLSMVLGMLWYGPLFGKKWMGLMGYSEKNMPKGNMGQMYILAFVGALVMAYVLSHFVDYAEAKTLVEGAMVGFWVWLGFMATLMLGSVLWEGKPWELYFLNAGHKLVEVVVIAVLLTMWV
ncbi:DUF1761 domain-containing protein [Candidatus Micrarchaeota archaeon]|nr:DUF1761 domain-containing protein [Candidatus Micrarchaeota archaeon]